MSYSNEQKAIYISLIESYDLIIGNTDDYNDDQIDQLIVNMRQCISETIPDNEPRHKNFFVMCVVKLRTMKGGV